MARTVDRLCFTDSDEANRLLADDPFALLMGFAVDRQVTVQKVSMGPLVLRERRHDRRRPACGHGPRAGPPRAPRDQQLSGERLGADRGGGEARERRHHEPVHRA
jgi:hypothetical protein